jgi:phospholipid transport system substrate-binding protein
MRTPLVLCSVALIAVAGIADARAESPAVTAPPAIATPAADGMADGTVARAATPNEVVEQFHDALIEMMKGSDQMSFDERVEFLTPRMTAAFDLDFMSSKSVGRQWKALSSEQQRAWREKFERLTVSNYAGRFVNYQGEHFETLGNEPAARDTVMVLTRVEVPGDEDVDLNYRLRETREGWRIIDVYLKGTVSELALRRSEYSSTLKRDGFEKLATAIDEKIAELREEGQEG